MEQSQTVTKKPHYIHIAGVDEAGRGPLAGPVVAAVVILNPKYKLIGLKDSKKLTPEKRQTLAIQIMETALDFAIGRAEVFEIDEINIFRATLLAMQRAVQKLTLHPKKVLVDGTHCPKIIYPSQAIIKGDDTEPCISAASILAKVERDKEMIELHEQYPEYGFAKHKGYCTQDHVDMLMKLGPCQVHRRSFEPVKSKISAISKLQ